MRRICACSVFCAVVLCIFFLLIEAVSTARGTWPYAVFLSFALAHFHQCRFFGLVAFFCCLAWFVFGADLDAWNKSGTNRKSDIKRFPWDYFVLNAYFLLLSCFCCMASSTSVVVRGCSPLSKCLRNGAARANATSEFWLHDQNCCQ